MLTTKEQTNTCVKIGRNLGRTTSEQLFAKVTVTYEIVIW